MEAFNIIFLIAYYMCFALNVLIPLTVGSLLIYILLAIYYKIKSHKKENQDD